MIYIILINLILYIAIYIDVQYFILHKYCKKHEDIIEYKMLDLESLNETIRGITTHVDKNINDYNKNQNEQTLVKLNDNIHMLEIYIDSYRDKLTDLKYEIRDLYDHI